MYLNLKPNFGAEVVYFEFHVSKSVKYPTFPGEKNLQFLIFWHKHTK
jgi:hypothetical protein